MRIAPLNGEAKKNEAENMFINIFLINDLLFHPAATHLLSIRIIDPAHPQI